MSNSQRREPSATISVVAPTTPSPQSATGVPSHTAFVRRLTASVLHLFRPLLKVNLLGYRSEMSNALFPAGKPEGEVVAPDPPRMLFIGDSGASSYGVLNHGLGVVSQAARYVAREHSTGCSWTTITDTERTMARAVQELPSADLDVDVLVILLGAPDVLLGTTAKAWSSGLHELISTVRQGAHPDCPVVVAAIPPMYRFRAMPRFLHRLMALQITRLNRASLTIAETIPGVRYAVYPSLEDCDKFIQANLNWKNAHSQWGKQVGAATALALEPHLDRISRTRS